jgi:DNA-binding MarR family transcriptional regulator
MDFISHYDINQRAVERFAAIGRAASRWSASPRLPLNFLCASLRLCAFALRYFFSIGAKGSGITSEQKTHVTQAEYESLAAFRYVLRKFMRFSEEAAQSAGLTPQQHQALLTIKGFPGRDSVTVGELAEWLQIKHHSAVGLVNRLVAQDLVERKAATEDRRQVYISLTERGTALLSELTAAHKEEVQRIGTTLKELLERLK